MADLIRHNTIFLIALGIQDKSILVEDHVGFLIGGLQHTLLLLLDYQLALLDD